MSANLALGRNGEAMIASFRQMPWHRQGVVFNEPVTGEKMLRLAQLDWDVLSCPIYGSVRTQGEEKAIGWDNETDSPIIGRSLSEPREVELAGIRGIYRSDTGKILGLASEKYEIFQNREMVEIMDQIAGDNGMTYEVAGGLGDGERVWILANIPDLSYDVKGDAMKQYLTIFTSHDGSSALNIFPTSVRVVCANTWRMATVERKRMEENNGTQNVKSGYSIKHTRNMKQMVAKAVEAFKQTVEANKFSREFYRSLAEVPATTDMKEEFFTFIVDGGKENKELSKRADTRRQNKRLELEMLLKSPTNQTLATAGTAWGLWNTASEWIDHLSPTRKVGGKDEESSRFESSQFGGGCDLKDMAMDKIAELAGV